jgi:hypothetical protein
MEPKTVTYQKETYQRGKILYEIFSRPMDLFDFFLNGSIRKWEMLLMHFLLWIYAPLCKLAYNFIHIRFFLGPDSENIPKFTEGLLLAAGVYPTIFLLLYIFETFETVFFEYYGKLPKRGLIYMAFFPFSASCIFWILPKPLNFFGICLSIIISGKNYYEGLINLKELDTIQIKKLLLLFLMFTLFFSFLFLMIFGFIRNS